MRGLIEKETHLLSQLEIQRPKISNVVKAGQELSQETNSLEFVGVEGEELEREWKNLYEDTHLRIQQLQRNQKSLFLLLPFSFFAFRNFQRQRGFGFSLIPIRNLYSSCWKRQKKV